MASEAVTLGTNLSNLCFPFCEMRFELDSLKVVAIKVEIQLMLQNCHFFSLICTSLMGFTCGISSMWNMQSTDIILEDTLIWIRVQFVVSLWRQVVNYLLADRISYPCLNFRHI